jgi:hypothetical protein
MSYTQVKGNQILDNDITTNDIQDGTIVRSDINITSSTGLITNLRTSTGISMTYTGGFPGTGTVTISLDSSTGGITAIAHRGLDQLVHVIAETSYYEINRSEGRISSEIWWTDSGKTLKIREIDYTYSGINISSTATKQYDGAGNVVETYTETYNRTGNTITSIDGVFS